MRRIVLVGLSGSGKSSVGSSVAARLGFDFVDTDREVVNRCGMPVVDIFARFGEPVFRTMEREVLREACRRERVVVATGGGAVTEPENWLSMRHDSVVVHLKASPNRLVERLEAQLVTHPGERRPLLERAEPEQALERLWQERAALYEQADLVVETDELTIDQTADLIVRRALELDRFGVLPITSIGVPTGRSDIHVAAGLLGRLGVLARRRWPQSRRAWIISDDTVWPLWGSPAVASLSAAGFKVESTAVPAGEHSKSLQQLESLLDWLLSGKLDRRDIVVALGGGVVGDLGGFAAAIALRGVGLVQVPTSLLAMVDSSVGGKTAINHRLGKNLIGAFYQPQLVLADTDLLSTMPQRELRSGWAEIVKHAMIERSATGADRAGLLELLERGDAEDRMSPEELAEIVRRNVLIKAAVVRQDEREEGMRRILNYGHTLGHAMEAAGYRYLHGEAIALGTRAAAAISLELGLTTPELVARQNALLHRLGLPERFEGGLASVLERLGYDKKAVSGTLTWVLLSAEPGVVELRHDVPIDVVVRVAQRLGATASADASPAAAPML